MRDLKEGAALNHMPPGRFDANPAWLALNVIAKNLVRWLTRTGLSETLLRTKTVCTRHFSAPGRLARSARRTVLRLPLTGRGQSHSWQRSTGRELCASARPRSPRHLCRRAPQCATSLTPPHRLAATLRTR